MAKFTKDDCIEILVIIAENFRKQFRPDPSLCQDYIFRLDFKRLFTIMFDQLTRMTECESHDDTEKLRWEFGAMKFHWPLFKSHDFRKEVKALWTGTEYEETKIILMSYSEKDPGALLLKMISKLIRSELTRIPPLKTLPPKDEKITLTQLEKLKNYKKDIHEENSRILGKKQKLEQMLLDLDKYVTEMQYMWFVTDNYFIGIVNSTLYEMGLKLTPPGDSPWPAAKRTRRF